MSSLFLKHMCILFTYMDRTLLKSESLKYNVIINIIQTKQYHKPFN